jgi:hypothetical protein
MNQDTPVVIQTSYQRNTDAMPVTHCNVSLTLAVGEIVTGQTSLQLTATSCHWTSLEWTCAKHCRSTLSRFISSPPTETHALGLRKVQSQLSPAGRRAGGVRLTDPALLGICGAICLLVGEDTILILSTFFRLETIPLRCVTLCWNCTIAASLFQHQLIGPRCRWGAVFIRNCSICVFLLQISLQNVIETP